MSFTSHERLLYSPSSYRSQWENRRYNLKIPAHRIHRAIVAPAVACLRSSPAISHLAGEPDPALSVPTDNWTNRSHSLRANRSSPSLPLSIFLSPLPFAPYVLIVLYVLFFFSLSLFSPFRTNSISIFNISIFTVSPFVSTSSSSFVFPRWSSYSPSTFFQKTSFHTFWERIIRNNQFVYWTDHLRHDIVKRDRKIYKYIIL